VKRTKLWLTAAVVAMMLAGCTDSTEGGGTTVTEAPPSTVTDTTSAPPSTDGSSRTNQLNDGNGAVFNGSNDGGANLQATTTYLNAVIKDVDTVWSQWFTANHMAEPMVNYTIVQSGETLTSQCKLGNSYQWTSTTPNAMFCPQDDKTLNGQFYDGTVWLPVQTFASMWSGNIFGRQANAGAGDFAAAALAAHEYGHKVQEQLSGIYGTPAPLNPQLELIADCFTGVWAYTAFSQDKLSRDDLEVALHALGAIGDTVGSHGTNAERDNALLIGLNGTPENPVHALPSNCTRNYWPALPMK
jgi:predicted metalloprotease